MHYDTVIIGGGPAGLACAERLSRRGQHVLVVEQKNTIGAKVCAGGITWNGLLQVVPASLIEQAFSDQHVFSQYQHVVVSEKQPIIATVDRIKLGQHMADKAIATGTVLLKGYHAHSITPNSLLLRHLSTNTTSKVTFSSLVGADGSSSTVRRYLGLPVNEAGIGINYQVLHSCNRMEWHLVSDFFKNGYGWIFPHSTTISIGGYVPKGVMTGKKLQIQTCNWAAKRGINLQSAICRAGLINYDYRGHTFGSIYLAGDAAGLSSALTGEGIFPAIISGQAVADSILTGKEDSESMSFLLHQHNRHRKIVGLTSSSSIISSLLSELGMVFLRFGFLNFEHLEMARR